MPPIHLPTTTVRDVTFDELDPETIAKVSPEDVAVLRAEWFPRVAGEMGDGPPIQIDGKPAGSCGAALREWAKRMTAKQGSAIPVWRTPLPWLAALAVVIYGEAPMNVVDGKWVRVWPEEWSPSDVVRALAWESVAKVPAAVTGRGVITPGTASVTATLS
jgi:hypothetical protein